MTQLRTTAREIIAQLASQGRTVADIASAEGLAPIYEQLRTSMHRADIPEAERLLGSAVMPQPWPDPAVGVIVETRPGPHLEYVIGNLARYAAIPIHLFHGTDNADVLKAPEVAQLLATDRLRATCLGLGALSPNLYNGLFLSRKFWSLLSGRGKILVFQTDSLCCPASPYRLADFLSLDYVGANWDVRRPVGLVMNGGCGGFSLRDWRLSLQTLERIDPRAWTAGEDGYFAFHMDLLGARVADVPTMDRFASQACFNEPSFGAHKVADLQAADHERFLAYCPEITLTTSWRRIRPIG